MRDHWQWTSAHAAYCARQVRQDLTTGGRDVRRIIDGHLGPAATSRPVTPAESAVGIGLSR
jgi:hypothetical protein